jgi:hypothetical protein
MAEIHTLRPKKTKGAIGRAEARPPAGIACLSFKDGKAEVTTFAHGSLRERLFRELERLIASKSPLGQLLKFFRDDAHVNIEFLLWLVRWLSFFEQHALNEYRVCSLTTMLTVDPEKNISRLAAHEESRSPRRQHNPLDITKRELFLACSVDFNARNEFEQQAFNNIWPLMLVIFHAYRMSASDDRPSLCKMTKNFLLRNFAPVRWAREASAT